ncbi:MAG: phosphoribosylanthranilate isomerase [Acidobacteriota bacterium]
MTAVKICGITRADDALRAADLGARAVGVVLWPDSPRAVSVARAAAIVRRLPPYVTPVGVFVRPTRADVSACVDATGIRVVQVHGLLKLDGLEGPWTVIPAVRLGAAPGHVEPEMPDAATVLIDAHDPVRHGGTGVAVDWEAAALVAARRRVILAGGLTPATVARAIEVVRPYAVDVASGVEAAPGVKDPAKMRAFIEAVRTS